MDKKADRQALGWMLRVTAKQKLRYRKNQTIRIVFFVQEASLWPKSAPVAEEMMASDAFRVTLWCIPHADVAASQRGELKFTTNESVGYLQNLYREQIAAGRVEIVDARQDVGWVDLAARYPHYVFFARPYDMYLPLNYRSDTVEHYAKCCYIPYGFSCGAGYVPFANQSEFTRNLSFYFASEADDGAFVRENTLPSPLRSVRFDGYPLLYRWLNRKKPTEDAPFTVLWTPRWKTDATLGGNSSFFLYHKPFLEFAKSHADVRVIVRPHPMMLENFVSKGQMTRQEADEFVAEWEALPNGRLDLTGDYKTALEEADVLVTDFSSIVMEYFLTGRPILYCNENEGFTKEFSVASKTFYYVDDWNAIEERLSALIAGTGDDKAQARKEAVAEVAATVVKPPRTIMETILRDYHGARRANKLLSDET